MSRQPFALSGPAIISFSGGRTSAYMLWRVLQAHGGVLPSDVVVCFANTGREMPATLDFVARCASEWGVHVNWLEYRRDPETGHVWTEIVSHNSASRHSEPFRAMLAAKSMLPNPTMRFCTVELKIRTVRRFVDAELGWKTWKSIVGLRFDELHRVVRMAKRNAANKERFVARAPLAAARITKEDHILPFWRQQRFDLQLAGAWEGNCDGCFLKSLAAKRRLIADHPDLMAAWRDDEQNAEKKGTLSQDAALYRKDVPSYAALFEQVRRNPRLPGLDDPGDGFDPMVSGCESCGA